MISRRRILKNGLLAAGSLLAAGPLSASFHIGRKPRVIVLGAGFSGLAAAFALSRRQIDFTVLEARNRVGGRVFSHVMNPDEPVNKQLVVELGAEWIGNSHERIQELCDELKLVVENNQFDTHLLYRGAYSPSGKWDYSDSWKQKLEKLLEAYRQMPSEQQEVFDQMDWWRYLVSNGCSGRDLEIRELLDSTDFGESIRHVSAYSALSEYAESSEKNEMDKKIKGGNNLFARTLAGRIGMDRIKPGHRVSRIVQNDSGVKVYCENGAVFEADKIICTLPTFAVSQIRWEPELSPEYTAALQQLQYARINKNPLLFRQRFWKDESFDLVTDQTHHYFYHATKNQAGPKGALISYSIGDKAAVIAGQSDAWRADTMHQTLSPHFGNVKGLLDGQANYFWGNDAYSYGAYAMYGVGQVTSLMPVLQKSHLHTVFAGEHLAEWQGFMEGAIATGESAAARI